MGLLFNSTSLGLSLNSSENVWLGSLEALSLVIDTGININ